MRTVPMTDDDQKRFLNGGKFPDSAPKTEWRWEGQDMCREAQEAMADADTLLRPHGLDVVTLDAVDTLLRPHGLEVVWCCGLFTIAERASESAVA